MRSPPVVLLVLAHFCNEPVVYVQPIAQCRPLQAHILAQSFPGCRMRRRFGCMRRVMIPTGSQGQRHMHLGKEKLHVCFLLQDARKVHSTSCAAAFGCMLAGVATDRVERLLDARRIYDSCMAHT